MRNPQRIPEVLNVVGQIWSEFPDMRFNQLIDMLQWEYASEWDDRRFRDLWMKYEDHTGGILFSPYRTVDLYFLEDDDFLQFLKMKHKEWTE